MTLRTALRTGAALLLALAACDDLPTLQAQVCGNAVIEAGEDCDTFASEGMRCTGPDEPVPCRFSCHAAGDGGTPRCPEHWGCGLDGVCRQPSGSFAPVGAPIAAAAFSAITGDFDGDGRKDVLTRGPPDLIDESRGRVHYFDEHGALAVSRNLLEPMISPIVADVDGDGCDDLICGVDVGGLLTWRGTRDRQLFPVPAPFFQTGTRDLRLIPVEPPFGDTRYLVLTAAGGRTVLAFPGAELAPLVDLGDASRYAAFTGEPTRGQFADLDSEACAGFALAFPGDHKVTIFRPCRESETGAFDWAPDLAPVTVQLGEPVRGVFAADLNGDGHLDLLIAVLEADDQGKQTLERVRVAYGDGTGHFASSLALLAKPDGKASIEPWSLDVLQSTGVVQSTVEQLPLAAGQLNGDRGLDFVFPTEILTSVSLAGPQGGYFYVVEGSALHGAWTQAAIVDLNNNGFADVIAASGGSFDLDFYNGTGTYQLMASTIPTTGKVSQFVVGDVDGDLTLDVLFAQPPADPLGKAGLFVAFGQPGEQPLSPVKVGESEAIDSMFATGQTPLMPPVAMLTAPAGSAVATVSLLLGSTSRQPFAPSFLTRGLPSDADTPVALTAGPLGAPGTLQVFALAFDNLSSGGGLPPLASWEANASGQVGQSVELAGPVDFGSGEWPPLMAQGDVDLDGRAEVAILSSATGTDIWAGQYSPHGGRLRIGRLSSGSGFAWEQLSAIELPMITPIAGGRLALEDLDGDGFPEVLIASGNEDVAVLWNDGHGQFSAGAMTFLEGGARMFATVHDQLGGPPSLAYVTAGAVKRVRATGPGALGEPEVLLDDLTDGTGLAAGDVDGDGVEDLAVVDDQNLRILRGQAVLP